MEVRLDGGDFGAGRVEAERGGKAFIGDSAGILLLVLGGLDELLRAVRTQTEDGELGLGREAGEVAQAGVEQLLVFQRHALGVPRTRERFNELSDFSGVHLSINVLGLKERLDLREQVLFALKQCIGDKSFVGVALIEGVGITLRVIHRLEFNVVWED